MIDRIEEITGHYDEDVSVTTGGKTVLLGFKDSKNDDKFWVFIPNETARRLGECLNQIKWGKP